jgi:cytochrome c peroxidase
MKNIFGKIICRIRGYHKWYNGECKTCHVSLLKHDESFKVVGHLTIPATEIDIVSRTPKVPRAKPEEIEDD